MTGWCCAGATDTKDQLLPESNRGTYIAVAAPAGRRRSRAPSPHDASSDVLDDADY
ncbi:hypothetical protein BRADO2672 [Bradyrhizobium sp. ORS 278]|nr:hypothetical protein BRADO2672 [Bradyrhizobium sp. ORS 278]